MATKAMPPIPPRPTRVQDKHMSTAASKTLGGEVPRIPPRPINRRVERSQSPHRDSFAPSPLNEPSFLANYGTHAKDPLETTATDLPRRPSSVTLPSLGQEGTEYAEIFEGSDNASDPATQTRSVANDLHLHAPKPSLPVSSAKQRVSTVTRTDSSQAAALGIGKANNDDVDPHARSLKAKASFASQTSNSTERPPSCSESEHGIPEIGQRVPMYPNAGDVQAPSPAPFTTPYAPGLGFHNDGSKPRHHARRTSARGFEGPPGSYGLHGHGIIPNDRFEKAYYEKHPDLLKQESGQYSGALTDGRGEWALSSDDLNKIVRETASRGSGLGTSPNVMSTPSEQIGFLATEEYATRLASPRPQSAGYQKGQAQTYVDSPLRKQSIPGDIGKLDLPSALSQSTRSEHPHESETEDDDVVHIDPPERRSSVVYGSGGYMESTESLGQAGTPGAEEDVLDEHGYSAPILAADEVAKDPFGYELQPAVSPNQERSSTEPTATYRTTSASSSRPSSRPVSIHGGIAGIRFYPAEFDRDSHYTPLEDLEEYEPLFPEDEKGGVSKLQEKPRTAADKLKRPDTKNRKFPSQDIWEDTPNSLYYTTTVTTPQLPEEVEKDKKMKSLQVHDGETPEQAFARRQEELAEQEAADSDSFLNREKKPWAHNSDIDLRYGSKQRFPGRDIWESSPDSLQLTTTVSQPQADEKEVTHPPEDGPTTGAVLDDQGKAVAVGEHGHEEMSTATGATASFKPQVPARPTKQKPAVTPSTSATSPTDRTAPPIPAKSKPQVPARPARSTSKEPGTALLTKVTSASSSKSQESDQGSQPTVPLRGKPPVPTRPMGSKIAALQGGFMSDLNKRLQQGPQALKKEESTEEDAAEEKEKLPLADARKGRARGPMRRAPAKSPAPATELASVAAKAGNLGFSTPSTLWYIHPDHGLLNVNSNEEISTSHASSKTLDAQAPALATNTAGENLKELSKASRGTASYESSIENVHAKKNEEQHKHVIAADNQPTIVSKSTDPEVASLRQEKDIDDLSRSTVTLEATPKPEKLDTAHSTIEREKINAAEEHDSATTEPIKKLETLVREREVLSGAESGNQPTLTGSVEEETSDSFEHDANDTEK